MELNETELAIINRAFEKMPFPDDQETIDMLREKLKTGIDSLFDNNGESAENNCLDVEAKEYADKVPTEAELFDEEGNPAQIISRESAREVYKVCSSMENYRKDFFKTPKTEPSDDEIRKTLADFRLVWQYLTPENKEKMKNLAEAIGYNLPENVSKRIAARRRKDYGELQEMAKILKKDKNNFIIKNKLTTQSRYYVAGFFRDVERLKDPGDVVELANMALKANSLIQTNGYNRPYSRTAEYYETKAKILGHVLNGYNAMGDYQNAHKTIQDISKFKDAADRANVKGKQKSLDDFYYK